MVLPPVQLPSTIFPMPQAEPEEFLGKQVCYQDPMTHGESKQYTVTDHITSYSWGTYYLITDNEGMNKEVRVSEREILHMLGSV
jgi:hypothetical protein